MALLPNDVKSCHQVIEHMESHTFGLLRRAQDAEIQREAAAREVVALQVELEQLQEEDSNGNQ